MTFTLPQAIRIFPAVLGAAAILAAQPAPLSNTAQVKAACQAHGNTVYINQPVKVSAGAPVSAPERILTGCRFVFGVNGKLEVDGVGMRFNGPFTVQAGAKAEYLMKNALIIATTVSLDLGDEATIGIDEAQLVSRAGDIAISAGALSQFTVTKPLSGRTNSLQSSGSIFAMGGSKFETSVSETSFNAASGIVWSSSGNEGSFSATATALVARSAGVTISSPGAKSHLDYSNGRISAANGITVNYTGTEAQISFDKATLNAGIGGVYLAAGDNAGALGVVKLIDSIVGAQGGVDVRASVNALKGETVVEISRINAGSAVNVETGVNGVTSVKLNRLISPTLVRAVTGPSGACIQEGNTVRAPISELCP